jgi:hypothetical protein
MALSGKSETHPSQRISSSSKARHVKPGRGFFSLAAELLGAVAISLAQRYAKSWSSSLTRQIKHPARARELPTPSVATERVILPGGQDRSEMAPKKPGAEKSYPKGVVSLFQNAAREWMEDKCPQLGAALAYFTVFSLAPLEWKGLLLKVLR